jgi:hypothetical protein
MLQRADLLMLSARKKLTAGSAIELFRPNRAPTQSVFLTSAAITSISWPQPVKQASAWAVVRGAEEFGYGLAP